MSESTERNERDIGILGVDISDTPDSNGTIYVIPDADGNLLTLISYSDGYEVIRLGNGSIIRAISPNGSETGRAKRALPRVDNFTIDRITDFTMTDENGELMKFTTTTDAVGITEVPAIEPVKKLMVKTIKEINYGDEIEDFKPYRRYSRNHRIYVNAIDETLDDSKKIKIDITDAIFTIHNLKITKDRLSCIASMLPEFIEVLRLGVDNYQISRSFVEAWMGNTISSWKLKDAGGLE